MKKIIITVSFFLFCLFLWRHPILGRENNKFGISLLQPTEEDIKEAAELVNGNGGDWGYVTLVIQENDKDLHKWQDVFEKLREYHLIPIIRLATSPAGEVWKKPDEKDAVEWVQFLNKLNWVIKKRYIILFNEPNHASEWGGEVNPQEYARIAFSYSKQIKESNANYIIMFAGLDAAAPHYPDQFFDSATFIQEMCVAADSWQKEREDDCTGLFRFVDAWSSHSYPNPGFKGSVWDAGKKSIRGYENELALLGKLNVKKDLPVFITETGWDTKVVQEDFVAQNYKIAYEQIWGPDERVYAVTPFVFKYIQEPFIGFSWRREDKTTLYYNEVKELKKTKGNPEQVDKGTLDILIPKELVASSSYRFPVVLKNTGQAIWDDVQEYVLQINEEGDSFSVLLPTVKQVKPNNEMSGYVLLKTNKPQERNRVSFTLLKGNKPVVISSVQEVSVKPLPEITLQTSVFPKLVANARDLELQIFDEKEDLVFRKKGTEIHKGKALITDIQNIIPGALYRVVIIGYPYLPRQSKTHLSANKNTVVMKPLLPFDTNGDGTFTFQDVFSVIQNPQILTFLLP